MSLRKNFQFAMDRKRIRGSIAKIAERDRRNPRRTLLRPEKALTGVMDDVSGLRSSEKPFQPLSFASLARWVGRSHGRSLGNESQHAHTVHPGTERIAVKTAANLINIFNTRRVAAQALRTSVNWGHPMSAVSTPTPHFPKLRCNLAH